MNEAINYVLTRMAVERGVTHCQMQDIIEEAIHAAVTSSDPALREEMLTRFGSRKPSTEQFIEEIGRMIDSAHLEE